MTNETKRGRTMLLGFPEYREPARELAAAAGMEYAEAEIHRFPGGESLLQLAAATARRLGAKHLTLVAPYLCYMRQDKAFHAGEAVSQPIIGRWLATLFDALLTVDPHLHRVHDLRDAVPLDHAVALTATREMSRFLSRNGSRPLLIGPDEESEQWVAAIARQDSLPFLVARKERLGDRSERIELPPADYAGRQIVLVDDIASTGCTLEETAKALAPLRPADISVLVTHALFVGNAQQRLHEAGVEHLWSCDSVPHPTNRIPLAPLLAEALTNLP